MANFESRENRAFAFEIKFLVSGEQADEVREWARRSLQPDPNTACGAGDVYRTTSLYYDTFGFDVFHRRGSFGRAKYRVRRYDDSSRVFLERKLRSHNVVTKRRTLVDLEELNRLREEQADRKWAGGWFHGRLLARAMHASCQISYSRTALVAQTAAGLIRLTLDEDLRASRVTAPEYVPVERGTPLLRDQAILEMKFRVAMPVLFQEVVDQYRLEPLPVSKYRLAMTELGCEPMQAGILTEAACL